MEIQVQLPHCGRASDGRRVGRLSKQRQNRCGMAWQGPARGGDSPAALGSGGPLPTSPAAQNSGSSPSPSSTPSSAVAARLPAWGPRRHSSKGGAAQQCPAPAAGGWGCFSAVSHARRSPLCMSRPPPKDTSRRTVKAAMRTYNLLPSFAQGASQLAAGNKLLPAPPARAPLPPPSPLAHRSCGSAAL